MVAKFLFKNILKQKRSSNNQSLLTAQIFNQIDIFSIDLQSDNRLVNKSSLAKHGSHLVSSGEIQRGIA